MFLYTYSGVLSPTSCPPSVFEKVELHAVHTNTRAGLLVVITNGLLPVIGYIKANWFILIRGGDDCD